MGITEMRTYISEFPKYKDSKKWRDRVKKMPAAQVYAIYMKFKNTKPKPESNESHQITMFEYMASLKEDQNG